MLAAMFLRRIVEHLKTQNWTAVGIELLIVIIGVFIGAQASNWNEARKVRAGEREYLQRLADQMAADTAEMHGKNAYIRDVTAAIVRTDAFIRAGRPCAANCWPVLVDFFVASQWQELAPQGGVFAGLQASPYPYDQALKQDLIRHYNLIHEGARLTPPTDYRQRVRMLIPLGAQQGLWRCNVGFGTVQRVDQRCPATVSEAEAGAIVERLRRDEILHQQLTYAGSMLTTAITATDGWMAESRRLIGRVRAQAKG